MCQADSWRLADLRLISRSENNLKYLMILTFRFFWLFGRRAPTQTGQVLIEEEKSCILPWRRAKFVKFTSIMHEQQTVGSYKITKENNL